MIHCPAVETDERNIFELTVKYTYVCMWYLALIHKPCATITAKFTNERIVERYSVRTLIISLREGGNAEWATSDIL